MNIAGRDLLAQYYRAKQIWPFIDEIEARHGLTRLLLYAVGSRETNLDPRYGEGHTGDGGYGHGPWQLDNHPQNAPPGTPEGFQRNADCARIDGGDVPFAAEMAASQLRELIDRFGVHGGIDAYNSGRPTDESTTGHDYAPDVLARLAFLQSAVPIAEMVNSFTEDGDD